MISVDLHTHTNASHGKNSVTEMYTSACKSNLEIFGFSEHSPRPSRYSYPEEYREHLIASFDSYAQQVMHLRETSTKPQVLFGMELDWFHAEEEYMRRNVEAYPFDYIIGGIHFLDSWGFDFIKDDWDLSMQECSVRYENYYRTMKDMAESGLVNIVAHPDLIKIFSIDSFRQWIQMPKSLDLIWQALKAIKDNDLVMEVSSAGLRKACAEIYPCPEIMRLAAEFGIPISFASDAHCINTPAFAFDRLEEYARSFGYSESAYFIRGKRFAKSF
ncbi:MAG: histidinol-phosphatase [Desulfovibrionaceae bacterium]|nr:histidinol-phosphatase [Desulfovibrionaceae bacterium]